MSYLINRYKGTYRLLCDPDDSNQFPREFDGSLAYIDVYIDCQRGIRIFHYGRNILQAYIPSIGIGHNIIKQIYALYINPNNSLIENKITIIGGKETNKTSYNIKNKEQFYSDLKNKENIIFDIEESDEEVLFKFKSNDDEKIIPLLKPRTNGANRSPFSTKNLPKAKYDIPENDIKMYNELTKDCTIDNGGWLNVTRYTKEYIHSLANKRNTIEDIKKDMAKKMIKGKEYIHSIGKWNEYIKYLKVHL